MSRADEPSDPGASDAADLGLAATKEAPVAAATGGTVMGPSASDAAFDQLLSRVASTPRSAPLLDGAQIGEYRVVKLLGKGTFGTVYHGAHSVIEKQAALKVLNAQFSDDAKMVQRFVDEARAVNRIAHPNIVDIFGFGQLADGRKYCVMELLEGDTLAQLLEKGVPSWPVAGEILRQIAAALDAAHDAGVVHRDLKPDNVFVGNGSPSGSGAGAGPQLRVKLLDFGIAQVADGAHSRTGSGVVLGTPIYMSPEQCRGARVDRATDIYALGIVAFELLTGKPPFAGDNAMQYIAQHMTARPPAPSRFDPKLPAALDEAVLRMLSKAPEERPARASEGIAAILHALGIEGGASLHPAVSLSPGATARRARWPWLVALGVAALSALAVAVAPWQKPPNAPASVTKAEPGQPPSRPPIVPAPPQPLAAPPAAPPSVVVRVLGKPKQARVYLDGRELGGLDEPLPLPRGEQALKLKVQAPDFAPQVLSVVPKQDAELTVSLKRKPPSKAATKNDELEY